MTNNETRKPTIGELFEQEPNAEAFFAKARQHYPNVAFEDVMAEVKRELDGKEAEYRTLVRTAELMDGEDDDVLEVLERKAAAGVEDAAELLAALTDPTLTKFQEEFEAAAEEDPHWRHNADGSWTPLESAVHDTPEKLVEAARRARRQPL